MYAEISELKEAVAEFQENVITANGAAKLLAETNSQLMLIKDNLNNQYVELNSRITSQVSTTLEKQVAFDEKNETRLISMSNDLKQQINELKQTILDANGKREKENEELKTQIHKTQLFAIIAIAASAIACIIGGIKLLI